MFKYDMKTYWAVVTHAFNPGTWEVEESGYEFESSLVLGDRGT